MATASFPNTVGPPGTAPGPMHVRRATSAPASGSDTPGVSEVRHEIQSLVAEITRLASQDLPPAEFYHGFLTRVVTAMAAVGGAIWKRGEQGQLELEAQVNLAAAGVDATPVARGPRGQLLKSAMLQGQAVIVPPAGNPGSMEAAANTTPHLIVLAPIVVERECAGIIEIFQRTGGTATAQRGYARFLVQVAELAASYVQHRRLRQVEATHSLWRELEAFVDAIHQSLDLKETSFAIANDGRRIIGCDRLSLAIRYGGHSRIEAVSGLDAIDRRAGEAKSLSRLVEAVLATGEPLWWDGAKVELPPQIAKPLDAHVDRSHARLVAVLPLASGHRRESEGEKQRHERRRPIGALVVEQFTAAKDEDALRQRAQIAAHHSARALTAAMEHSSILLLPFWKTLGKLTWIFRGAALPKTLAVAAIVAGAAYALTTVPTDFQIAARGKLQPAQRREVFAPLDGLVTRVPVEHGQIVEAGTVLAELTSTDLDLQVAALLGRQTTNQERLTAISRALLDNKGGSARLAPADENRLAGEMLELRQEAANIEQELALVRHKQRQLTIVAPVRGQVITWKVRDLLEQRPVIRGQALLKLADPEGPWELELYVPERRLAHVQRVAEHSPQVTFVLSSHPGQTFQGKLAEIDAIAEVREGEGNTVLMRATIEKEQLPPLHDQTTVTAKLHCGRTSVGYAWFCDFVETVQSKVLFWMP